MKIPQLVSPSTVANAAAQSAPGARAGARESTTFVDTELNRWVGDSECRSLTLVRVVIGNPDLFEELPQKMPNLQKVSILGLQTTDGGFTPARILSPLARLMRLESLEISGAMITDEFLRVICAAMRLKRLHLSDCSQVTDTGLQSTHAMRVLELDALQNVTSDGLMTLVTRLINLEELAISGHQVQDALLERIGTMPQLTSLTLRNCPNITLSGLQKVRHIANLTVAVCQGITQAAIRQFASENPRCVLKFAPPHQVESGCSIQ